MTLLRSPEPSVTSVVYDCAVAGGGAGPHPDSVPFHPLTGARGLSDDFIPQVFLLYRTTKALPSACQMRDQTQKRGEVLQTDKRENSLSHTTFL